MVSMSKVRQDRVNSLGLASLNNLCRLWALEVVPSWQAPDPGMVKAEDYCLLGRVGQGEEARLWVG